MPLTAGGIYYADNSTAMSIADITAAIATSVDDAIGGEWTAYTPTFSGATMTSNSFKYSLSGTVMRIIGNATLSTISTGIAFSLPAGFVIDTTVVADLQDPLGQIMLVDANGNIFTGVALKSNTAANVVSLYAHNASTTYLYRTPVTSSVPFTWVSGDSFRAHIVVPVVKI